MKYSSWNVAIVFLLLLTFPVVAHPKDKPEIYVQLGHTGGIQSVAISSDGQYALSGSSDGAAKLWEIATGREIKTFLGCSKTVAFSPNGRQVLAGCSDGTLKLWDSETGGESGTFKGHTDEVNSAVFFSKGQRILSTSKDATAKVWDAVTGREIRTFADIGPKRELVTKPDGKLDAVNVMGPRQIASAVLSPDEKVLWTVGDIGIKLWDIETGKEIRQFADSGQHYLYSRMGVSPDGKYILSTYAETINLWDTATEKRLWTHNHSDIVRMITFDPHGRYILWWDMKGTLTLWDVVTNREVRKFTDCSSATFSADGIYVISGSKRKIKIWDVETGKEIKSLGSNAVSVSEIIFTKDGRHVLAGNGPNLTLWDISSGRKIRTFTGHQEGILTIAMSPDGRFAVSAGIDKTIILWDAATGVALKTMIGHTGHIGTVKFSPDGRYLLSASNDNTVRLWEVNTGRMVSLYRGDASKGMFIYVAFFPDGRSFVASYTNTEDVFKMKGAFNLYALSSSEKIRTISRSSTISGPALSDDGRFLFSNFCELVDANTGRVIWSLPKKQFIGTSRFSPDGAYLLTTGEQLNLWDVATGGLIRAFEGHINHSAGSTGFSPTDSRYFVSGAYDGTVRLWNIYTGREIASFVNFADGEWIVITPEGYYNSSAKGDRNLNVRIGNKVYGIDQYRAAFYKPRIVESALMLGDSEKAVAEALGGDQKTPTVADMKSIEPPFIVLKSPEEGKTVATQRVDISLYVEDRNRPVKQVKLYVNGRQVSGKGGRGVKIQAATGDGSGIQIPEGQRQLNLSIPVELDRGENLIEITAFNGYSEGRQSLRLYADDKQIAKKADTILPNLWILSIGVNHYQDNRLAPLSYAVSDAEAIVTAFQGQKGKLFRNVHSMIISDKSAVKPTFDNILDNLNYVKKAGHNDVVILFIAGHGINDESGDFYFLPADAVIADDGSVRRSKAISWREIKSVLDIPAKKLIFADTCHSEGLSGKKTRGVDNDRFVKELQEANAVIFTSSRGRELSQESDQWGHGAFTHALIEGLQGKADLMKRNRVTMKELDVYVSETVPQLTNGAQHPITNTPDGYVNFPIAILAQ